MNFTHSDARALPTAADGPTRSATSAAVRILDRYLRSAIESRASDIHLEPCGRRLRVRMRIDGCLCEIPPPPPALTASLLTRVRLLARVDLAERRAPRDGRFEAVVAGRRVDIRAAFVPVYGGEKVTLRLLGGDSGPVHLDDLGLARDDHESLVAELDRPGAMIIVTGPTGSGKTTTLYAALAHLAHPQLSLITVEDPVERDLDGISQIAVDADAGRGFAESLRALLRHDPDVVMIGEIRDPTSAAIACRAALTGHRLLTTLHTSSAGEALVRLADLGVARYLVNATVTLVIAQRLVRRLCEQCARGDKPGEPARATVRSFVLEVPAQISFPVGCPHCNGSGYRSRVAVFEFLSPRDCANPSATRTLTATALALAARGVTSVAEVLATCPRA